MTTATKLLARYLTIYLEIIRFNVCSLKYIISERYKSVYFSRAFSTCREKAGKAKEIILREILCSHAFTSVRNVNVISRSGFITEMHVDTLANLLGSFVLIHPFRQLMKARAAFNSAPGIVFNVCLREDCNQLPRCA